MSKKYTEKSYPTCDEDLNEIKAELADLKETILELWERLSTKEEEPYENWRQNIIHEIVLLSRCFEEVYKLYLRCLEKKNNLNPKKEGEL